MAVVAVVDGHARCQVCIEQHAQFVAGGRCRYAVRVAVVVIGSPVGGHDAGPEVQQAGQGIGILKHLALGKPYVGEQRAAVDFVPGVGVLVGFRGEPVFVGVGVEVRGKMEDGRWRM